MRGVQGDLRQPRADVRGDERDERGIRPKALGITKRYR